MSDGWLAAQYLLALPPYEPPLYDLPRPLLLFTEPNCRTIVFAAVLLLFVAQLVAVPDTLVVCPAELRPALARWLEFRLLQGHRILVVPPEETAEQTLSVIRQIGRANSLRFLVIVGDVTDDDRHRASNRARTVPTHYLPARINARWDSEPTIATDAPYADLDGDGRPELAVGRIPVDTNGELAAVVRKIERYEGEPKSAETRQRIYVTAGVGGFGAVADSLIEAAARQVLRQTVPKDCAIEQISANPNSPHCPRRGEFTSSVRRQLSGGGLAWIYLGHGLPTELDRVRTPAGEEGILSVADVPHLRCSPHAPVAVLIACYSGAIDSRPDCLAEALLVAEEGPIAVIAATRVTMPYGNTVLGYELLRACFADRPATIGDIFKSAQSRTLDSASGDTLRLSLNMFAQGISPPPVDLELERREHAQMYHLFGDPLTRLPLHRPDIEIARSSTGDAAIK